MAGSSTEQLERNLRLIPVHAAMSSSMLYLPIFVLFTRANFGVSGALEIASYTYLFIVALEVPSGWMSDRLGRVPTLRVAAASMLIGQLCFLFGGDTFAVIVLGQFFVSSGYAFISGTDVSFHYDTLEALGRPVEYQDRQARVSSISYLFRSAAAICGGLLGLVDLRLAFGAAVVFASAKVVVTWMLYEPPSEVRAQPFVSQIGSCLGYLRDGFMAWLFFYGIALVTLEHVAHTLMQPWLTQMLGRSPDELGATPLVSGVLLATVAFVGAGAARASSPLGKRFGTVQVLVGLGALSAVIVSGMALTYSVVILVLVVFRSAQGAAAPVLISAAVAPRAEQHHRATLLSINSLAGRFTYGTILRLLAGDLEDDPRPFLEIMSVISWAMVAVLVATGIWAARRQDAGVAHLRRGAQG